MLSAGANWGPDIKEIYLSMFSLRVGRVLIAKGSFSPTKWSGIKERKRFRFRRLIADFKSFRQQFFFGAAFLEPVYKR